MYSSILFSLATLQGAYAWGDLGHETVAYVASHYVKSATKNWAQNILGDTSTSYLANVATWADSYRYTSAGRWSEPLHFIDAQDDPPNSCNVDYDRDCIGSGCIVSALANYTTRVQSSSLSSSEVETALKFIIHFVGDITQPLHDENYEYGANDVDVTFNGDSTNLHHVWDTNAPEQLRGSSTLAHAKSWASDIVKKIDGNQYPSSSSSWVQGLNVNNAKGTSMSWATDANAYVCSVVMPNGAQELENESDLYPDYYNSVIDTLELQIAKGGYRLAKWLDAIASNQNSRKRSVVEEDLSGKHLLVHRSEDELTPAQRRRLAVGYGCNHKH